MLKRIVMSLAKNRLKVTVSLLGCLQCNSSSVLRLLLRYIKSKLIELPFSFYFVMPILGPSVWLEICLGLVVLM